MAKLAIARYVSLLTTGLGAGVSLSHALQWSQKAKLSGDEYWRIQSMLYKNYALAGAILETSTFASIAAAAYLAPKGSRARTLSLLGLGCQAAGFGVWALRINPINKRGRAWTAGNLPDDWAEVRDRWHRLHAIRLGLFLTGFSALLLSVLTGEQAVSEEAATSDERNTDAVVHSRHATAEPYRTVNL